MTTEYVGSRIETGGLPPRSALLRAFGESGDRPEHSILEVARELAECHEHRYRATLAARAQDAPSGVIAACARRLDDIDGRRRELVGHIDRWVADNIAHRSGASLHTETLGAVIDRLASKWIAAQQALGAKAMTERPPRLEGEAHLHWTRLAELADGYQDLITDVIERRRRLPIW